MNSNRGLLAILALAWLATACASPAAAPGAGAPVVASTSENGAAATARDMSASEPAAPIEAGGRLSVISTVSPLTNIVYNVGGDKIDLTGLIPQGSDSHTFEPAPSDARLLAEADLVFVNGLKLEEPTVKLAEANRKAGAEIIQLGDRTVTADQYVYDFSFPKAQGSPNPHLWMNPMHARRYSEIVRDVLAKRDPANAASYAKNQADFAARIDELDKAIAEVMDSIPPENRKLITYHDSFAYFAPRYGLTVIGAIQPADFAEPSAREVAEIIRQVKQTKVPAIFGSEVFPSPVLDQIAREAGAVYVDTLKDDDLPGKPGDPRHSYFGQMVDDVVTLAKALGGDPAPIVAFDTSNIPGPDTSVRQMSH